MTGSSDLRVLHLTTSFPVSRDSTSGIFIYRLISYLPKKIMISVLLPDFQSQVRTPSGSFHVYLFRYAPKKWQTLTHGPGGLPAVIRTRKSCLLLLPLFFSAMLFSAIRLARRNQLIHAHWTITGVIAGIVGLITSRPVVTTLRGEDANRSSTSVLHRLLLILCLRLSDKVVTVSEAMKEKITRAYPNHRDKIQCIPNGVGEEFFAIAPKYHAQQQNILVLGSLIPVKGVDLAIEAFSLFKKEGTAVKLLLGGRGPEQERLAALAKKNELQDDIIFLGQIEPEKVPELLGEATMFIQASYREGRPNALLEAMAAGLPVIGSAIDGIEELIEHGRNGLLFTPGDAHQLADCLAILLSSPQKREQMGQQARKTMIKKNLTWPATAQVYTNLYQSLVEDRNG